MIVVIIVIVIAAVVGVVDVPLLLEDDKSTATFFLFGGWIKLNFNTTNVTPMYNNNTPIGSTFLSPVIVTNHINVEICMCR